MFMHVIHLAQVMHPSITTFVQEQTVRKINTDMSR